MATMTADAIVKAVRLRMDEIGANDSEMIATDKDDEELTEIIKAVIPDALRLVLMGADVSMLDGNNDTTGFTCTNGVGLKKLPADFMRLISVRMSSWLSSASDIISESSTEYRQQSDEYACATYQHPVAAIVHKDGTRYLELYKSKADTDTLAHFVYVARPKEDAANGYTIPDQLIEAVEWYAAGLSLTAVREDHAVNCIQIAKGLMGGGTE